MARDSLCVVTCKLASLYIADCKDESNALKPYSPIKKTVAVLKTLVLEYASLVHSHIMWMEHDGHCGHSKSEDIIQ